MCKDLSQPGLTDLSVEFEPWRISAVRGTEHHLPALTLHATNISVRVYIAPHTLASLLDAVAFVRGELEPEEARDEH